MENVVAQYPGVLQCAVIGIPDARWGEAVHAIIVVKAGTTVDVADLIAFCKERIAGYKCPYSVDVRTDPLPMSGAGKIFSSGSCVAPSGKVRSDTSPDLRFLEGLRSRSIIANLAVHEFEAMWWTVPAPGNEVP